MNKTPATTRELINNTAQNTQQFGTRENQLRRVNEISHGSSVETQLSQTTNILNKLLTGGVQTAVTCNLCSLEGHVLCACPNLRGGNLNVVFPNQGQRRYDPYSNTYDEGWRGHPNLRYGPRPNPPGFNQPSNQPSAQDKTNFLLEQMIKKMDE